VLVGRVGRPHGLRGDVVVLEETDNPARFLRGSSVWMGDTRLEVQGARRQDGRLVVRFVGVDDRTTAEALRGAVLEIESGERRPLGPDEYWPDELVGFAVHDSTGARVGTVVAAVEGAAQWRLVVEVTGGVAEIPFVEPLVPEVDRHRRLVRLADVPGLLDTGI
jgi:16S rRNA processing protein RimM